jgi:hypothetical protein
MFFIDFFLGLMKLDRCPTCGKIKTKDSLIMRKVIRTKPAPGECWIRVCEDCIADPNNRDPRKIEETLRGIRNPGEEVQIDFSQARS